MSEDVCRFYEEKYPQLESFVMVNVKEIAEMGAYVKLLEYGNIDGMILLSELSRRRIRSIQKLIRVGRNEVAVVVRVDENKGYIDLSKRRVTSEDIVKCEERYNKAKLTNSIIMHVKDATDSSLQELYEKIVWPLNKKHGAAVDAFKASITNPSIWDDVEFPSDVVKHALISSIAKRLTPQPVKVRADIEVLCLESAGIDAVKDALTQAEAVDPENNSVRVRLVAPPLYVVTTVCTDKQAGIAALEKAIENVEERIKSYGGSCVVRMAPKVVSKYDDDMLASLMLKHEKENAEVSGDGESSDED